MSPRRIQRLRVKGWQAPVGAVYVGRPADWCNPFRIGEAVSPHEPHPDVSIAATSPVVTVTPVLAVELFRAYVTERGWLGQIREELRGKDLICWCAPGAPCHGDVLLAIANG